MADNPLSGIGDKLGKLPPMAIVVVVGGALAIAYYVNRGGSGNTGTGGVPTEDPGMGGMPTGWVPVTPPTNDPTTPGYSDNEAWGSAAVGWLIGYGIGAVEAGTAVRKYLMSDTLTQREKGLIDLVSRRPPDGIGPAPNIPAGGGVTPGDPPPSNPPPGTYPPVGTNPPPIIIRPIPSRPAPPDGGTKPPAQPKPPTPTGPIPGWTGRVFQVRKWPEKGSSLWTIAEIVYGSGKRWPEIYNANRDRVSNPDLIYAGTWLRIP